jgi:DNA-binding CsgD family transcriptional regulator
MRLDFVDSYEGSFGASLDNGIPPRWCPVVTTRTNDVSASIAALTDGQRDCLRLVYNHMKSKDIARVLAVSPHTVDMRLRTAMRTLGVTSRIEAARLLVQEEAGGETTPDRYQPLIYQAPDVADPPETPTMASPALDGSGGAANPMLSDAPPTGWQPSPVVDPTVNGPPRLATASMHSQTSFDTNRVGAGFFDPEPSIHPKVAAGSVPMAGSVPWGKRNDLSIGARLGWIFVIAVGSAMGFGAILAALAALKNLI